MKKLIILMLTLTVTLVASAQLRGHAYYAPSVTIVGGYAPYYPYYNPLYLPYYGYPNYGNRPTRLDRKIEDIRNDYQERIWAVKHNKSLIHKERRQEIRQLKHERDKTIEDARLNYYRR